MVASLRSHRTALRLRGVPWLRTVLRSVCSPLQPFGPPPCAKRTCDVPCFTGVFVPACASLARYSGAAERFALFLNSAWSYHCARKLACGTPCFIGLTSACFAHCARPPCAPRPSTPSGLRQLRPVSATGGGLRAPLSRLTLTAWCKTPQSAPLTAPLTQGSLLASGTADCLAHYARSASTSPFCKVICESKAISQPFCRNATGASPSAAS